MQVAGPLSDQAESSQQVMTVAPSTRSARPLVLQRDGACLREGVARRDGCRRNWARTKPRTTITNRPHHNPERLVEKVGRSITNSETPHPPADGPEPTPSATSPTTPHTGPSRRRQRLLIDVVHTVRRPHISAERDRAARAIRAIAFILAACVTARDRYGDIGMARSCRCRRRPCRPGLAGEPPGALRARRHAPPRRHTLARARMWARVSSRGR